MKEEKYQCPMDSFMIEEHRRRQAAEGAKQIIAEALKKAREAKKKEQKCTK